MKTTNCVWQSCAKTDLEFETFYISFTNQRKEMISRVTFCGSMMLTSTVSRSSWGTDSPSLMIGHITSNMKFTILLEWFSLKESLKCRKCHRMVSLTYLVQSNTMKTSTKDGWKEFSILQIAFNCSFRCFLSLPNIFRIGIWKGTDRSTLGSC